MRGKLLVVHLSKLFAQRRFLTKIQVPRVSSWEETCTKSSQAQFITVELVNKLERLALVDFGSQEAVKVLESAVLLADKMKNVREKEGTIYVQDLERVYSANLVLADDVVLENEPRNEIMANAVKSLDNYFVSPTGNVALQQEENRYGLPEKLSKKTRA